MIKPYRITTYEKITDTTIGSIIHEFNNLSEFHVWSAREKNRFLDMDRGLPYLSKYVLKEINRLENLSWEVKGWFKAQGLYGND